LFHYKQALRRQLSTLELYKKQYKEETDNVLKKCGKLPFIINNTDNEFNNILSSIENNKIYRDFIKYFKKQWLPFLQKKNMLDYQYQERHYF